MYQPFLAKDPEGNLFSAAAPCLGDASFGKRHGKEQDPSDIIITKKDPFLSPQEISDLFAERDDARGKFFELLFFCPSAVSRCVTILERALQPRKSHHRFSDQNAPRLAQVLDVSTRDLARKDRVIREARESIPSIKSLLAKVEPTGLPFSVASSPESSPHRDEESLARCREISKLAAGLGLRFQFAKGIFSTVESQDAHLVESQRVNEIRAHLRRYEGAIELVVRKNLPLVNWVIDRFHGNFPKNIEYSDLFQEGTLGLISAAERYDLGRGAMFNTYAVWCVRQAVIRFISQFLLKQSSTQSLNQPAPTNPEGDPVEWGSLIVDPRAQSPEAQALHRIVAEETLRKAGLSERDVHILVHRSLGFTLDEIGQQLGITREWVRKLEAAANTRAGRNS